MVCSNILRPEIRSTAKKGNRIDRNEAKTASFKVIAQAFFSCNCAKRTRGWLHKNDKCWTFDVFVQKYIQMGNPNFAPCCLHCQLDGSASLALLQELACLPVAVCKYRGLWDWALTCMHFIPSSLDSLNATGALTYELWSSSKTIPSCHRSLGNWEQLLG